MSNKNDLVGKKFERLTVVSLSERKDLHGNRFWNCFCDCGNEFVSSTNSLNSGRSRSCGCLTKEIRTTHGKSKTKIYQTWLDMKDRCYNKNNKNYFRYGGRGITVSDEWNKFENFYKDMGDKQFEKAEIDRIDNDGNYCKENCRWVDRTTNTHNSRSHKNSKSKYKGVSFKKNRNKWVAACNKDGIRLRMQFETEIEAAIAYNVFSEHLYKDCSYKNKITMTPNEIAELMAKWEVK